MTDEEILAADIVLSNLILNDPMEWGINFFRAWLEVEREKYKDDRFAKLISDTTVETYNRVHGFLITQGYVGTVQFKLPVEYLTTKGDKAKKLGGHRAYLTWEKNNKIRSGIQWFIIYILLPIVTILTLWFTCNPPKSTVRSSPNNNHSTDSIHDSHKNNHP